MQRFSASSLTHLLVVADTASSRDWYVTLPPQLGIARRLVDHGRRVHVLADPMIEHRARAIGCGFTAWRRAPHRTSLDPSEDLFKDWEFRSPLTPSTRPAPSTGSHPSCRSGTKS